MNHHSMNIADEGDKYLVCGFSRIPAKRVVWRVTSACNRKCCYCFTIPEDRSYDNTHRKPLHLSEIIDSAAKLKALGYTDIQITGGEPFLRNDILEMVRELDQLGFTIAISTNCDFITQDTLIKILDHRVRSLNVSLDSHIPRVNDHIRGTGSFTNTLRVIEQMVSSPVRLRVHTVLTDHNRDHVEQVSRFLHDLGVKLHTVSSCLPFVEPFDEDLASRLIRIKQEIQDMEIDFLRIKLFADQQPHTWLACSSGSNLLSIYPDGTLAPCNLYLKPNWLHINIHNSTVQAIERSLEEFDKANRTIESAPCLNVSSWESV